MANEQNNFANLRCVLNKKYENIPILGFFLKMVINSNFLLCFVIDLF
jgi:hypothetical protein